MVDTILVAEVSDIPEQVYPCLPRVDDIHKVDQTAPPFIAVNAPTGCCLVSAIAVKSQSRNMHPRLWVGRISNEVLIRAISKLHTRAPAAAKYPGVGVGSEV